MYTSSNIAIIHKIYLHIIPIQNQNDQGQTYINYHLTTVIA